MAKKAELLAEAQEMGLDVTEKNTIAEINAALDGARGADKPQNEELAKEVKEAITTKAGKRSKKGLQEAEEKAEKIARQKGELNEEEAEENSEETEVKKGPKPKVRPLIERRSKKYKQVAGKIEKGKEYELSEAVKLAQETSTTSFDASVEIHVRLNVDPKKADQNIRGSLVLPNGTGKTQRVAVVADEENSKAAKDAGADISDSQALLADIEKGNINFDVLIASPDQMAKLGKYAKTLGPKGLMPNPKSGTVAQDVAKAVKEAKAGRVEYRVDKYGIIHLAVGKVSFKAAELEQNIQTIFKALKDARPSSIKGDYVKSIAITTSMGPSISLVKVLS